MKLDDSELKLCEFVAELRQSEAERLGRRDNHGHQGDGTLTHLQGVIAERIVSNALGLKWNDIADDPKSLNGDVGPIHVRSTPRADGCLILHKTDPDAPFVLVAGKYPNAEIRGWIFADHGKVNKFWREAGVRNPAYFVPQYELYDFSELVRTYHW